MYSNIFLTLTNAADSKSCCAGSGGCSSSRSTLLVCDAGAIKIDTYTSLFILKDIQICFQQDSNPTFLSVKLKPNVVLENKLINCNLILFLQSYKRKRDLRDFSSINYQAMLPVFV